MSSGVNNRINIFASTSTFTIASDMTISGQGTVGSTSGTTTLINNGTILSDTNAMTITADNWNNTSTGTMRVLGAGNTLAITASIGSGTNDGLIQADTLIASSTRVATLSLTRTLTEIRLTDEVRHEFYRRFTCDQRVGNLFAVNGPTVRLRDPAEQFLATAMILFDPSASPPDIATIRTTVRALANDHFGPFDPNITCR